MMAYQSIGAKELRYDSIERFVKKTKTHRNVADSDKTYIKEVWKRH